MYSRASSGITPAAIDPIAIVGLPLLGAGCWLLARRLVRRRGSTELVFVALLGVAALSIGALVGSRDWIAFEMTSVTVGATAVAVPIGIAMYEIDRRCWSWFGIHRDRPPPARRAGSIVRSADPSHSGAAARLLVAPVEELLYRGVPTAVLASMGPIGYAIASASLFGIAHAYRGRHEVLFKTGNGVGYAIGFLAAGTLLVPIGMHLGYNAAAIVRRR